MYLNTMSFFNRNNQLTFGSTWPFDAIVSEAIINWLNANSFENT